MKTGSRGEGEVVVTVVVVLNGVDVCDEDCRVEWVELGSGRGGAGPPTIAEKKVCRGSLGSVLASVAAADSCEPSKVERTG